MLYLKKQIENAVLGVWKIEETCETLFSLLSHKAWLDKISRVKSESRRCEMLATRVLLKELLDEEKQICYYESGKPYLADNSFQISISHTENYVAIILDKTQTMGLDIEQRTDKIFKVKDRLISKDDYIDSSNEQIHLLLHWSAKEAMFKYLNAEGVDFRKNLHVEGFTPNEEGVFYVSESKTKKKQHFKAYYMVTSDFVMVCLAERDVQAG